ncbi:RNA-binding S4 domain-containing protein [Motilimonas sp. 1_MG-2023]|uniref:RNA-binding S4 domain-containing protein n=1 Tax=Motilimonas sp. 1_MG-2023 TaxID=3062672 RepID=UPI0026E2CC60|nr:RNA-binding S4 domain-containing protein [Motilimonas sp. 1_MG-2023]MDO6527630.1 RNA-binding S4 domain-containing protein [Motilimonas sp. 1_MG-2023]
MSEEEYEIEALGVEVSCQPIELYKVLKIANAVSGGGEAKMAITEGYVAVNGDVETRKRCKVYDGDVIQFNGEFYLVLCDEPVSEVGAKKSPNVESLDRPSDTQSEPLSAKPSKSTANTGRNNTKGKSAKRKSKAEHKPAQVDQQTGRREIKF